MNGAFRLFLVVRNGNPEGRIIYTYYDELAEEAAIYLRNEIKDKTTALFLMKPSNATEAAGLEILVGSTDRDPERLGEIIDMAENEIYLRYMLVENGSIYIYASSEEAYAAMIDELIDTFSTELDLYLPSAYEKLVVLSEEEYYLGIR